MGGKNEIKSDRMEWKWRNIKVMTPNVNVCTNTGVSAALSVKQKNVTAAGSEAADSHKSGKISTNHT